MLKRALLVIVLGAAACGGSKKEPEKPADPTPTEPTAGSGDAAGGGGAPAEPAKPAGPSPEELAKQAMTEQVEAGKKVWAEKGCASCHGEKGEGNAKKKIPAVMGDKALPEKADPKMSKLRKKIAFKTAKDVNDFIKKNMPQKKPGSLSDDESLAVTAFILSENKAPGLDKKLDAESSAAINIR